MKKIFLSTILLVSLAWVAVAQTTQFTYQGNLNVSNSPASGNYDFEFVLFDALTNGTQLGSILARNGVAVSSGTFSVNLDFGSQFPGADRYLEVRVRQSGGGAFQLLTPRQQINNSPYSIKSVSADNATNAANATMAATATNALQLGGLAANQYVLTGDARLIDARNPLPGSANYIQNGTSTQASSNFNISGNGTAAGTLMANAVSSATQFNIGGVAVLRTPGSANTFAGVSTGPASPTGSNNSFFGTLAGFNSNASSNSFFGAGAGYQAGGTANSYFGFNAGGSSVGPTTGSGNAFFGFRSGWVTVSGNNNTFLGAQAGMGNDAGSFNVMAGYSTGHNNTGGSGNTFIGTGAGGINTTGNYNSIFGYAANVGGANLSYSTALGYAATVAQSHSIVLGGVAGTNGATLNPFVGVGTTTPADENARFSVVQRDGSMFAQSVRTTGLPTDQSFGLVIGAGTSEADTSLQINNQVGSNLFVVRGDGRVGMGLDRTNLGNARVNIDNTETALYSRSISGYGLWARSEQTHAAYFEGSTRFTRWVVLDELMPGTSAVSVCRNSFNQLSFCSSSLRYKKNVRRTLSGLDLVLQLQPITFDWIGDGIPDLGLGAEEVEKIEPLLVTYNETGQVEGVKYDRIGVVLINAVKEQQAEIENLQTDNHDLRKEVVDLRDKMNAQKEELNALKTIVCSVQPDAPFCRPSR